MESFKNTAKILLAITALGLAFAGCERRPADQSSGAPAGGGTGTSSSSSAPAGGGTMGTAPSSTPSSPGGGTAGGTSGGTSGTGSK